MIGTTHEARGHPGHSLAAGGACGACGRIVTAHPSAAWTLQQLREAIGAEDGHHYLLPDRDRIFSASLEESIQRLRVTVLKSPPRSPKANAICERLIGTIRRECLDLLIPMSEAHLRALLTSWVGHYNRGRPHMSLGPGAPDPPSISTPPQTPEPRHRIDAALVHAKSVLGGLHHKYSWILAIA